MAERVAVIIPTRNRQRLLVRAIENVFSQSFSPVEVIVVDDGSEDGTPDVLRERYGDRIVVASSGGRGANHARNLGASVTNADYLIFLDDDDEVRPAWLETLAGLALREQADLASCAVEVRDLEGHLREVLVPRDMGPIFGHLKALMLGGAFAIRRSVFESVGGYPADLPSNQQTGLALRLAERHEATPLSVVTTNEVGMVYRSRRQGVRSISRSFCVRRLEGTLRLLSEYSGRFERDVRERARYYAAAATLAMRLGDYRLARQLCLRSLQDDPVVLKNFARFIAMLVPPVARYLWPVTGGD